MPLGKCIDVDTVLRGSFQRADNPGLILRKAGHRALDELKSLPRDSRRPTDARSVHRYVADNRSYRRDQSHNYAAGLL